MDTAADGKESWDPDDCGWVYDVPSAEGRHILQRTVEGDADGSTAQTYDAVTPDNNPGNYRYDTAHGVISERKPGPEVEGESTHFICQPQFHFYKSGERVHHLSGIGDQTGFTGLIAIREAIEKYK